MKIIIIILQAILNLVRKRRDLIANRSKIPPEYRDDVVVWYSPKKQRLTNYDVIESYAEDFTYWTINNTSITSAQKKIVIPAGTELEYVIAYRGFNASTDGFDIKYTGNIAITYRYNKEDGTVGTIAINESGIYHLPASVRAQKNFGFYCNPQTTTEEATIEQLPTSILKDLSGNGNHAYLYGGKGKLNSGMGVYKFDFLSDLLINSAYLPYTERQYDSICSLAGHPNGWLFQYKSLTDIPTFKIEVKGIVNDKFHYRWYDENGNRGVDFVIDKDGIYEFPMSYSVETNTGVGIVCNNICQDNVCFTQIPDYPNQLCYDGKMYAVCYGFPILTDYTVMADRTWFDKEEYSAFVSNSLGGMEEPSNGAFSVEVKSLDSFTVMSFGSLTSISTPKKGITYQTKQSYNGISINVGTRESNDVLTLGGRYYYKNDNNAGNLWNGCHDDIIILKRSLTINEINDITEAIFNETIIEE